MNSDNILRNTAYDVYKNLFKLAEHRGWKVKTSMKKEADLPGNEEALIETDRCLFVRMSDYVNDNLKPAEITKICLRRVKSSPGYRHYVLAMDVDYMQEKKLLTIRMGIEKEYPNYRIEILTFDQMQFDYPNHETYIRHEVVDEKNDPNLFLLKRGDNKSIEIDERDLGNIWAGGQPGDLLRIYRKDGTIAYRRVVGARLA